jgi:hypothetical protein
LDVFPGNKLPGYDHLVPPGQSPISPSGTARLIGQIPGSKLPGLRRAQSSRYLHFVPAGQGRLSIIRILPGLDRGLKSDSQLRI